MCQPTLLLAAIALAVAPLPAQSFRVLVVDTSKAVVPNARVQFRTLSPRRQLSVAVTGANGEVGGRLQPPLEVMVTAAGFEPAVERVTSAADITVELRPSIVRSAIDVMVRDDGAPLQTEGTQLDIDRTGARTVVDAVDRVVPSAFVTRRGVMGYGISTNGTGGISIRGIGESPNAGVLVVVDGRPDYQGLMGHPLPDFYSLSDAGTVRVVEGPASVLYGSNAMGGVLEIKPWVPREGMSTRLTTSLGSYYTGQHTLAHGARFNRGFYSVNAGIQHTSGDRPSSDFRNQDGTVTAGYDLSSIWRASIEGRYGHFHVEDPGPFTAPLNNSYANVGRGGFTANLDNTSGRMWGYMRAYSTHGLHYITDGFRSADSTTGFRVDENIAVASDVTLQLGSDVIHYGGRARNVMQNLDYGEHLTTVAAGFARGQWAPGRRLRLHAGARYETNTQFGSIAAPEFGASFTLANGYTVSAEAGKGFRNPTIRELYLFPAPNPNLLPEHLWNHQLSFQARPTRSLSASVTAYYIDLSNLIVVTGRYPNLQLLNSGAALNRGVETTGRWQASRRIAFQGGYAYLRSTNIAPYIPAHKVNYGAELNLTRVFVYFGGMAVGERFADSQHTQKMEGYNLGTLKVTVPVRERIQVFTVVDNLFHQRYQVVPGYIMPGINAAGGVTVAF
jgi:outer membrane cobalamin receptor